MEINTHQEPSVRKNKKTRTKRKIMLQGYLQREVIKWIDDLSEKIAIECAVAYAPLVLHEEVGLGLRPNSELEKLTDALSAAAKAVGERSSHYALTSFFFGSGLPRVIARGANIEYLRKEKIKKAVERRRGVKQTNIDERK